MEIKVNLSAFYTRSLLRRRAFTSQVWWEFGIWDRSIWLIQEGFRWRQIKKNQICFDIFTFDDSIIHLFGLLFPPFQEYKFNNSELFLYNFIFCKARYFQFQSFIITKTRNANIYKLQSGQQCYGWFWRIRELLGLIRSLGHRGLPLSHLKKVPLFCHLPTMI